MRAPRGATTAARRRWRVSFGDGSARVGGNAVSHVYAAAGSYTVTVVATDKRGQTSSATETVFIAPDPPPPPPDPPPEEQPTG